MYETWVRFGFGAQSQSLSSLGY